MVLFFDPHLTTHHTNVDVPLWKDDWITPRTLCLFPRLSASSKHVLTSPWRWPTPVNASTSSWRRLGPSKHPPSTSFGPTSPTSSHRVWTRSSTSLTTTTSTTTRQLGWFLNYGLSKSRLMHEFCTNQWIYVCALLSTDLVIEMTEIQS